MLEEVKTFIEFVALIIYNGMFQMLVLGTLITFPVISIDGSYTMDKLSVQLIQVTDRKRFVLQGKR